MMPTTAGYLILAIQALLILLAVVLTDQIRPFVSMFSILLGTLFLGLLFASLLKKGVGSGRSLGDVLLTSFSGIIALPTHFANLYLWLGIRFSSDTEPIKDFWTSLYFSVVTWTTLGYGDIVPIGAARFVVIVEAALGYVLMALLIAAFVRALGR